jgi:hypothetical protein
LSLISVGTPTTRAVMIGFSLVSRSSASAARIEWRSTGRSLGEYSDQRNTSARIFSDARQTVNYLHLNRSRRRGRSQDIRPPGRATSGPHLSAPCATSDRQMVMRIRSWRRIQRIEFPIGPPSTTHGDCRPAILRRPEMPATRTPRRFQWPKVSYRLSSEFSRAGSIRHR